MGGQGAHVGAKRAKYAKNKNNIYRVRNVPKYKRATQDQISVEPKAKDSRTVFGFKFWPHPGGEPKNNLLRRGEKALYNKSLEGISEQFRGWECTCKGFGIYFCYIYVGGDSRCPFGTPPSTHPPLVAFLSN